MDNCDQGVMLLFNKNLPSHDLVLLKDAIQCLSDTCILYSWGCSGRHYRYIAPKTIVDEHAAPGQVEEEEQPDFIICILENQYDDDDGASDCSQSTNSFLFCGDSILKIRGDGANEFMERCLPDYRLRADVVISGFSTTLGLKVGSVTLGSQHLGILVECDEELLIKFKDILLQFTPAQQSSISDFIQQLLK